VNERERERELISSAFIELHFQNSEEMSCVGFFIYARDLFLAVVVGFFF